MKILVTGAAGFLGQQLVRALAARPSGIPHFTSIVAADLAAGAFVDQGVAITAQNYRTGTIRGDRGGIAITASVRTLPDGRIEVKFDQAGATNSDPNLVHRISESYDRRMGR